MPPTPFGIQAENGNSMLSGIDYLRNHGLVFLVIGNCVTLSS